MQLESIEKNVFAVLCERLTQLTLLVIDRGRSLVNVRVDLPDLPLNYGSDTTSRSEVIEFTVN